ncbi:hypothetical protein BJY59DRAFT_698566 [Rhodotorula toruloides]
MHLRRSVRLLPHGRRRAQPRGHLAAVPKRLRTRPHPEHACRRARQARGPCGPAHRTGTSQTLRRRREYGLIEEAALAWRDSANEPSVRRARYGPRGQATSDCRLVQVDASKHTAPRYPASTCTHRQNRRRAAASSTYLGSSNAAGRSTTRVPPDAPCRASSLLLRSRRLSLGRSSVGVRLRKSSAFHRSWASCGLSAIDRPICGRPALVLSYTVSCASLRASTTAKCARLVKATFHRFFRPSVASRPPSTCHTRSSRFPKHYFKLFCDRPFHRHSFHRRLRPHAFPLRSRADFRHDASFCPPTQLVLFLHPPTWRPLPPPSDPAEDPVDRKPDDPSRLFRHDDPDSLCTSFSAYSSCAAAEHCAGGGCRDGGRSEEDRAGLHQDGRSRGRRPAASQSLGCALSQCERAMRI